MTSIKPAYPDRFAYAHPITVRYADLDPQQHVNNAAVVTYLESALMGYSFINVVGKEIKTMEECISFIN